MKYDHTMVPVRQLYVQEVVEEINQISRLIPITKIGDNLLNTLLLFAKGVISSFKYGISTVGK